MSEFDMYSGDYNDREAMAEWDRERYYGPSSVDFLDEYVAPLRDRVAKRQAEMVPALSEAFTRMLERIDENDVVTVTEPRPPLPFKVVLSDDLKEDDVRP